VTATSTPATPADRCLFVALELVAAGYALLPVVLELKPDGDKRCTFPHDGKGARLRSSTDPDQIKAWWVDDPRRSFAVDVHASGVEVVDLDVGPDGDPIGERSWSDRPRGAMPVRTRSGGWQFYFRRGPDGVALGNSAGRLAKVDTRGAVNDMAFAPGAWLVNAPEQVYTAAGAIVSAAHLSPVPDAVIAAVGIPPEKRLGAAPADGDPFGTPSAHTGVFTPDQALTYCRHVIARLAACAPDGKYTALIAAARSLGKFEPMGVKEWLWERCVEALSTSATPVKDWTHARRGFDDSWANAVKAGDVARVVDATSNPFGSAVPAGSEPRELGAEPVADTDLVPLLSDADLDELPQVRSLIKGVVSRGSLVMLNGMNQSYKSFVALDWALSVATGRPWLGRPVKAAEPVVYVAAEGAYGIRQRRAAWKRHHGVDQLDNFHLVPRAVQFKDGAAQAALLAHIERLRPAMVVIDTVHQSAAGLNENDAGEMSVVMARARAMTAWGATVVLVHHTGHAGERARGSSSLGDDADEVWVIKRDDVETPGLDVVRTMHHWKAKDSQLSPEIALKATPLDTGLHDEDGDVITSLVLGEDKELDNSLSVFKACALLEAGAHDDQPSPGRTTKGTNKDSVKRWLRAVHPAVRFPGRATFWAEVLRHYKACTDTHPEVMVSIVTEGNSLIMEKEFPRSGTDGNSFAPPAF
jgi:hypothetical protein